MAQQVEREATEDAERRVLTAAFRGQRALGGFERLVAQAGPRLEIDARALRHADAFTGVTVRETIVRHIAADPGHSVVLLEPHDAEVRAMLADLVGPLPQHARWSGAQPLPRRERLVLLPATSIDDAETAKLLAEALTAVTAALRLPSREARLLASAVATFADNALTHASLSLLSACRDPQGNDLQVVVLSPILPPAAAENPSDYVRALVRRSRRELGGLYALVELAHRRGIDATLRIAAGRGRLYWRGRRQDVYGQAPNVPGFVASMEVHLGA